MGMAMLRVRLLGGKDISCLAGAASSGVFRMHILGEIGRVCVVGINFGIILTTLHRCC